MNKTESSKQHLCKGSGQNDELLFRAPLANGTVARRKAIPRRFPLELFTSVDTIVCKLPNEDFNFF